jgi:hypothetical protein
MWVGVVPLTAFERPNALGRQSCPLGQLLQGEASRFSELPQAVSKR